MNQQSVKYICLSCNGKSFLVRNIKINSKSIICSLVNDGHDDLIDLGFKVDDFKKDTLEIKAE